MTAVYDSEVNPFEELLQKDRSGNIKVPAAGSLKIKSNLLNYIMAHLSINETT